MPTVLKRVEVLLRLVSASWWALYSLWTVLVMRYILIIGKSGEALDPCVVAELRLAELLGHTGTYLHGLVDAPAVGHCAVVVGTREGIGAHEII